MLAVVASWSPLAAWTRQWSKSGPMGLAHCPQRRSSHVVTAPSRRTLKSHCFEEGREQKRHFGGGRRCPPQANKTTFPPTFMASHFIGVYHHPRMRPVIAPTIKPWTSFPAKVFQLTGSRFIPMTAGVRQMCVVQEPSKSIATIFMFSLRVSLSDSLGTCIS